MDKPFSKGAKGMRRIPVSNVVPLRVSNRRDSLGIESFSSVAPPCYTSQREARSSVATLDGPRDENETEFGEVEDHASVSVQSCPELGQQHILPSPYSTEGLLGGYSAAHSTRDHIHPVAPSSTNTRSCIHGYTHTHSQCTIDLTSTPCNSHVVSQHPPTDVRPSGAFPVLASPYSYHPHHKRITNHDSTPSPTVPYVSSRGLPRAEDFSPPRPSFYHHHPKSSPSAVGHLTYHCQTGNCLHNKRQGGISADGENTPRPPASMDSNLTCLPEDAAAHRLYEFNAGSNRFSQDGPELRRSSSKRATNFVSLSRKSTFRKSAFFRQKVVSSSITGNFTIDPSLRVPSSLLKAVNPSSSSGMDNELPTKRFGKAQSTAPTKGRRKNLVLEVENGGIDVQIHLVPSTKGIAVNVDSVCEVDEAEATLPGTYVGRRQSFLRSGAYMTSSKRPSCPQSPTLLDLRLKEVEFRSTKGSSRSKREREFPLVARVHAPNPRLPFHLFASAIAAPCSQTIFEPTVEEYERNPEHSVPVQQQPHSIRRKDRTRVRAPLSTRAHSRSPITLQLPRTFCGPLTIHVAAGDLDTHIWLSRELAEAAMVLAESAFSRGYFVGRLASLGERDEDSGDEWVMVDDPGRSHNGNNRDGLNQNGKKHHIQREREGEATHGYSGAGSDCGPDKRENEEWSGDKVDVVVGNGKVYLQFLDEEDPFGKKGGFWNKIGWGCQS